MAHNLLLSYGLYRKMEIYVSHSARLSPRASLRAGAAAHLGPPPVSLATPRAASRSLVPAAASACHLRGAHQVSLRGVCALPQDHLARQHGRARKAHAALQRGRGQPGLRRHVRLLPGELGRLHWRRCQAQQGPSRRGHQLGGWAAPRQKMRGEWLLLRERHRAGDPRASQAPQACAVHRHRHPPRRWWARARCATSARARASTTR